MTYEQFVYWLAGYYSHMNKIGPDISVIEEALNSVKDRSMQTIMFGGWNE